MASEFSRRKLLEAGGAASLGMMTNSITAAQELKGAATEQDSSTSESSELLRSILSEEDVNEALKRAIRGRRNPLKSYVPPGDVEKLVDSPEKYPLGRQAFGPAAPETIVRLYNRPVVLIQNNTFVPSTIENAEMRNRLEQARKRLEAAIPSVGRIELENSSYDWVGTGWLVDENIIVTNRHVAAIFGTRQGDGFVFRVSGRREVRARIDFLEERGVVVPQKEFQLTRILYIEDDQQGRPDIAFLQVARSSSDNQGLAKPVALANRIPSKGDAVAVIGYPAEDSRIPEPEYMQLYFGGIYDVKRLAPGLIMGFPDASLVRHDCTTLGGNSCSVVLDLKTGEALGLHFEGIYRVANHAVPATVVQERLDKVKKQLG
jgi:endonuclease G, mitochondrial